MALLTRGQVAQPALGLQPTQQAQFSLAKRPYRFLATKKVSAFMSEIRVELASEFKGETVVLLAMDGEGLDAFRSALALASLKPSHLDMVGPFTSLQ